MARSGPKPRTPRNSPRKAAPVGLWAGFEPPEDYSEAAKAEFFRLKAALSKLGTLEVTDPRLVCVAAELHGTIHQARAEMEGQPLTLPTVNGMRMQNPLSKLILSYTRQLGQALQALGLTSRATKNAVVKPETDSNPWEGLLNVAG